jgi:hypothetical protein
LRQLCRKTPIDTETNLECGAIPPLSFRFQLVVVPIPSSDKRAGAEKQKNKSGGKAPHSTGTSLLCQIDRSIRCKTPIDTVVI